jgi:hypothetical protein
MGYGREEKGLFGFGISFGFGGYTSSVQSRYSVPSECDMGTTYSASPLPFSSAL